MTARPALRYHGSKWRLAPWIISHFPPHISYVEPFAGSAAVLLRKQPSPLEVYNDADGAIVTFFRTLRDRPDALIRAITLTPYAKAEYELAWQDCDDELETARRVYACAFLSIAGPTATAPAGWRRNKTVPTRPNGSLHHTPAPEVFARVDHLWTLAHRLRTVLIEQGDAFELMARYDNEHALFYLDPPYVASTRGRQWSAHAYTCELTDDDHRRLAQLARTLRGFVVLSGYPSPLYDKLYADWPRFEQHARTQRGQGSTECLWLSPRTCAASPRLFTTKETS